MSHVVGPSASRQAPPSAYSARPLRIGSVSLASQSGSYAQPASAQAITSEDAAAMATFLPRAIGPADSFKLQLGSLIAFKLGCAEASACKRSHVPSVDPPSTMMISAGTSVCWTRLDTSPSMSSASFSTVAIMLTDDILSLVSLSQHSSRPAENKYIRGTRSTARREFTFLTSTQIEFEKIRIGLSRRNPL